MTFQILDAKENYFLDLLDDDYLLVMPAYTKGSPWLSQFSYSNLLCVRATRVITNHIPTGEYCLRFFLRKNFNYLCRLYLI